MIYHSYKESMGLTMLRHGEGLFDVKVELDSHYRAMLDTIKESIDRCHAVNDLSDPESAVVSLAIEADLIAQYYEVMAQAIRNAEAMDIAYSLH